MFHLLRVIIKCVVVCFLLIGIQATAIAKTYRITKPTDLKGGELVLKEGSKLVFRKNGSLKNGTVRGNNAKIVVKTNAAVFDNVRLEGSFANKESYLTWWKTGEDISDEMESLASCLSGTIYLDKTGTLSRALRFRKGENVTIDGGDNTIYLENINGTAIQIEDCQNVNIHSLTFSYKGRNPGGASHNGAIRIKHTAKSQVYLHDITIDGFDNSAYNPCGFDAIQIENAYQGTITDVNNVTVKDIVVKGDGVETNGKGANYAISVDCHQGYSGKVRIHNCHISNMYNVDENGKKIYEDTSGIYLGGSTGKDDNGNMQYSNWDAIISDCHFKDVSKRNIKIQGNNVKLSGLHSETTSDFLKSYQNMYVGIEGSHIDIDGIYGQYDGCIVKITGDYLTLRNMDCTSDLRDSKYAHTVRLDGALHAVIENCKFDNDTYMFIYPTERNFTDETVPVYTIKRCQLNVKNLLYCITNFKIIHNKGKMVVEDSDVNLSGTYCSNSKSLDEISLQGTTVKHKGWLASDKADGGPRLTVNKSEIIKP